MRKGVVAHYLFQRKGIGAGFAKPGFGLDQHPVFIYIVHAAALPSVVIGEGQVIFLTFGGGIARLPDRTLDPDIIVIISVCMSQYDKDIELICGVPGWDSEFYPWLKRGGPLLAWDRDILFENVRRDGAGREKSCKQQAYKESCKP